MFFDKINKKKFVELIIFVDVGIFCFVVDKYVNYLFEIDFMLFVVLFLLLFILFTNFSVFLV